MRHRAGYERLPVTPDEVESWAGEQVLVRLMRRGRDPLVPVRAPDNKRRPVLVLARDSILDYLGEVTIAPITSTVRDIPTEVLSLA